jgi:hypothetical protein
MAPLAADAAPDAAPLAPGRKALTPLEQAEALIDMRAPLLSQIGRLTKEQVRRCGNTRARGADVVRARGAVCTPPARSGRGARGTRARACSVGGLRATRATTLRPARGGDVSTTCLVARCCPC